MWRRAIGAATLMAIGAAACTGGGLRRKYEYEEEVYLDTDGSATVLVNTSLPALATTGDVVNELTALVGDPNVSMHEGKAFVCDVERG